MRTEEIVTADYASETEWKDDDPSVFVINIMEGPHGEFQVTNGYGPKLGAQVMRVFNIISLTDQLIVDYDFWSILSKNEFLGHAIGKFS